MIIDIKPGRCEDGSKTITHEVWINHEQFNVPNISKYEKCDKKGNCKYYRKCNRYKGVVRKFDCIKNLKRLQHIYNFFMTFILIRFFIWIFIERHTSILKGVGIMLIFIVILDIICEIIQFFVPKIRDKEFYRKLIKIKKKAIKKEEKEKEIEKAKKAEEDLQKILLYPYYQEIVTAQNLIEDLKELIENSDFGVNNKKIQVCVGMLEKIITVINEDSSNYVAVSLIFNQELPRILDILNKYSHLQKVKKSNNKYETMISVCLDTFLADLESKEVKSILNKETIETQFEESSRDFRKTFIDKKGKD